MRRSAAASMSRATNSSCLAAVAPACPDRVVSDLIALLEEGIQPKHLALLLDQSAESAESRMAAAAELVWTGPESTEAHSRDTAVVLGELFASATRSVLVSTYVVRQGRSVFSALADRMAAVPGLRVQLFLHVGRVFRDTRHDAELLRAFGDEFGGHWPWPTRPQVYYDPRSLSLDPDAQATWHAKCVVVDDEVAFVTSANFTEWAQQKNVEAGVLVRSPHFARQLRHQFESLVQSKAVRRLPGF
jgi:phosphatidylserine/phosphatidylglycerophosphate/cardiolipin synthase-like enzyme